MIGTIRIWLKYNNLALKVSGWGRIAHFIVDHCQKIIDVWQSDVTAGLKQLENLLRIMNVLKRMTDENLLLEERIVLANLDWGMRCDELLSKILIISHHGGLKVLGKFNDHFNF